MIETTSGLEDFETYIEDDEGQEEPHRRDCPALYGWPCECGADPDSDWEPPESSDPHDFEDQGGLGFEPW